MPAFGDDQHVPRLVSAAYNVRGEADAAIPITLGCTRGRWRPHDRPANWVVGGTHANQGEAATQLVVPARQRRRDAVVDPPAGLVEETLGERRAPLGRGPGHRLLVTADLRIGPLDQAATSASW